MKISLAVSETRTYVGIVVDHDHVSNCKMMICCRTATRFRHHPTARPTGRPTIPHDCALSVAAPWYSVQTMIDQSPIQTNTPENLLPILREYYLRLEHTALCFRDLHAVVQRVAQTDRLIGLPTR